MQSDKSLRFFVLCIQGTTCYFSAAIKIASALLLRFAIVCPKIALAAEFPCDLASAMGNQ